MRKVWQVGQQVTASDLNGAFLFGGNSADGALAISSGVTNIDCAGAALVVKNYSSISITGTGVVKFINPHANGTTIIVKVRGNVTLTSSAAPMIDASAMGGAGGAAQPSPIGGNGTLQGIDGQGGVAIQTQTNFGRASGGSGGAIPPISIVPAGFNTTQYKYPFAYVGAGGASGGIYYFAGVVGNHSGKGGNGGGALIIECGGSWNFTTANGISVAGENGGNGVDSTGGAYNYSAGGGGGGGGFLFVQYNALTANSGTVNSAGGIGGNTGAFTANNNATGGGGGASAVSAGAIGQSSGTPNTKVGGNGGAGTAIIQENTDM